MRGVVTIWLLACAGSLAQTMAQSNPAARAAHLMDEAEKLADQKAGKAMESAVAGYREAASLWREVNNAELEAKALEQVGVLSLRLGNLQPSLENLTAALRIFRELHSTAKEQVTLNNIGLVQSRLGNQRLAIESETEALRLAQQIGDRGEQAVVLNNLGLAYHELGEERQATEQFETAVQIQHELGNAASEGAGWSNLGAIHYTSGDLQDSLEAFEHALALRRQGKDRRGEANTIGKIAVLRHALGEDQQALVAFQDALKIDREVGDHLEESIATMNMGNVYMAQSRYLQAIDCFDRAMRIQEQWGKTRNWADELSFKAVALAALGRSEEAEKSFKSVLAAQRAMDNRRGEAECLARQAALFLKRGRSAEGAESAAEAARVAAAIGDKRVRAEALYQLARCDRAMSRPAEALMAIDGALQLSEVIRGGVADYDLRASFFSKVRDQYDLKVDLLMQTGDVPGAFETAEHSRARSLYDLIRNRLPAGPAAETAPVPFADLQRELDPETVALEYSLGADSSYVFIVTDQGIDAKPLAGRGQIEGSARKLYAAWSAHQDSPADCQALSRILLGPVENAIRRKRVVVIPDGALAYIPFGALFDNSGRRMIEDRDVVTTVSLSTLKLLRDRTRDRAPAPRMIAVLADPVFTPDDPRVRSGTQTRVASPRNVELARSARDVGLSELDRLPATRREAAAISALSPAGMRWVSLDFDASRAAVTSSELQEYGIIHFATHGLMNSRDPRLSGLVFSMVDRNGRPQSGFLRADEVANLQLGADLIVLSACQTALGKELRGEGLLALSRSFMYAGAPRVVASLWRVADSATTELMSYFYEALLRDRVPASEALRRATIRLMRNPLRATPYYWAGFTLQGDWR